MTWVRLDDLMPEHPKVIGLSDGAFRVHIAAICYASRNLTDGMISSVLVRQSGWQRRVSELVEARLWNPVEGGFVIHDYLAYNQSREDVLATRERSRSIRAAGGRARASAAGREGGRFTSSTDGDAAGNSTPANDQHNSHPVQIPDRSPPTPPSDQSLTQKLWDIHELLSGRITPPKPIDEAQFGEWISAGLTSEMVQQALDDTLSWKPERPWPAFMSKLGELVARPRLQVVAPTAHPTLTAEQVASMRGEGA